MLVPKRKTYDTVDDYEVVRGKKGHDAILEFEPGREGSRDEGLAQAASRNAKLPAYVLWLNDEYPRVRVFVKGKYAGEINAWPDAVAKTLGCTFPTCDGGRGTVDLTPHKAPAARKGERTIGRWTVRQWKHMIAHDSDWSILLDGSGEAEAKRILPCLDDNNADVRFVACKLLDAIGYIGECEFGLGTLVGPTLERLREIESSDRDKNVRAAATEAADDLARRIEEYAIRAEFPWIVNFDRTQVARAFAALDDDRAAVRSRAISWWWNAHDLPKTTFKKVETKLRAMRNAEKDKEQREHILLALDGMRAKNQRR